MTAMTDYLLMITERPAAATRAAVTERAATRAAVRTHLAATGALVDGGELHPSAESKRVRRTGEALAVEAGPFDATLESYYLVRTPDLAAATALAKALPLHPDDVVDVRPVMKGAIKADKLDQPGKVFAFAVLGAAADEPTWIQQMDRIDLATHDKLAIPGGCGGVRLEAPTTGRRVAFDASKARVVDGPFLECKEVIGGLFFLRMPSLEDATRWASASPFVALGGLEIRELWRS
ncbi:MAG: YciI family protein [Deltaproteobacteria bacterium]|nr:YciI family protein [Deltaproteobacteria bacterium]